MSSWIALIWKEWTHFWFSSFSSAKWKIFRAAIGINMFSAYLVRHFSLRDFYSPTEGIFISDPSQYVPMSYRWNFLGSWFQNGLAEHWIFWIHGAYLVALLLMILGVAPRLASVIAFILHVSFIHANIGAVYGVDLIFTFFLFFFCLTSDRVSAKDETTRAWISSMALRFAQIQVCIIYAFSGWEKLKGAVWWNGEALWSVLANPQLARFDFTWLSHAPLILVGVAYLTLIWEIYFPVLVWVPRMRLPTLLIGVLFHLSIAMMMNLVFFGLLMITTYILFLNEREIQAIQNWGKRIPYLRYWMLRLS
jgi:hypothetical protein